LIVIALAILPASAAAQGVRFVSTPPRGLQDAVAAASDGDLIVVKASGNYDAIVVQSKALTIAADQGVTVRVRVKVQDLAATQRVELRGLLFRVETVPSPISHLPEPITPLLLSNNQGAVWIEECAVDRLPPFSLSRSAPGIVVARCADVVMVRTRAEGIPCDASGFCLDSYNLGDGVVVSGSRLAALDCVFQGARGVVCDPLGYAPPPSPSGIVAYSDARVFLSGCQASGGRAAQCDYFGCSYGGSGVSSSGLARVIDSDLQGGTGTCPGTPATGNVHLLPGRTLHVGITSPVREAQAIQLDFAGPPNAAVWLLAGARPTTARFLPIGPLVIDAPIARFVGTTDATGALHSTRTMPQMARLIQFGRLFLQGFYMEPGGQSGLGSAALLVALDSRF
jgi:hypothetical protein